MEVQKTLKMGDVSDFSNFMSAVIDKKAFDRISGYIKDAKSGPDTKIGQAHDIFSRIFRKRLHEFFSTKFISRSAAHQTPNFMNPEYLVCLLFEYFFSR